MAFTDESHSIDLVGEARRARNELHEHMEERMARQQARLRATAKTRKSADTRSRIMSTAAQVILEQGNTAFQMSEISRRCGMSKGALYYYFSDKDDLVRAVFDSSLDDLVAAVDAVVAQAQAPDEGLVAVGHEFARRATEGYLLPIAIVTELVQSQDGIVACEDMRSAHIIQVVADLVEKAKETGGIRAEIDTRLAAISMCGAFIFGALDAALDHKGSMEFAAEVLDMIVRGVGPVGVRGGADA